MKPMSTPSRRSPHHRRGASAVEYVLLLTFVVIPLGLFFIAYGIPMIVSYSHRMGWVIRSPFG